MIEINASMQETRTNPIATRFRLQKTSSKIRGSTNWNLNAPKANQHPALKSASIFNALKPRTKSNKSKIESWPCKNVAKTGKKAIEPRTNSQGGIARKTLR